MKHDTNLSGAELIAAERRRQIEQEGWTEGHDDEHDDGSLLLAAICYAAPVRVFVQEQWAAGVSFNDPWPESWDDRWDKRGTYGNGFEAGNGIADPDTYTPEQRMDLLVKAGALIAAEVDRMRRAHPELRSAANDVGVLGLDAQTKPPAGTDAQEGSK